MLAMKAAALPSRRVLVRNAALLAAAVLTATWGLLATADNAHAESGRRLCMYVNGQRVPSLSAARYVVVNYKKEGKCPYLNTSKYGSTLIINQNPVPKFTCEQVSEAVQYKSNYSSDICGTLNEDTLYVLQKLDRKPFDPNLDIFNLGSVRNFE
jgi:hypothetical protein